MRALQAVHAEAASQRDIPQAEIDAEIAEQIGKVAYCPEELLCVVIEEFEPKWTKAARELAYAQLRGSLADAITNGTPANYEAVGRIAVDLLRTSWSTQAEESLRRAG